MESPLQKDVSKLDKSTSDCDTLNYISVSDVVRSKSCSKKIGLVTDVADKLDWYDSCFVSPDQVRVQWNYDTDRECVNRNEITVVGRYLTPGDFVASALDPSGQCGVVIDVNILVDLLAPDGSIIEGVNTRELIHVKKSHPYCLVLLGSWIGRVNHVIDNVTVLFDNGSVREFNKAQETFLKPIDKVTKVLYCSSYPGYFPGQRVCYKSLGFFLRKPESLDGVVTKVSVESVYVQWFAYAGRDGDVTKPNEKQSPEKLELLPYVIQAHWFFFENCFLKNVEGVLKIVNVEKKVDVIWLDGTTEKGLDSITLIEKQHETSSFFSPQRFVRMIKNTQENNDGCEIGFIKSVDSKKKTALVRWQDEKEREVSIYELEIHPDRKYFYGEFVGWLPHYTSGDVIDHSPIGIVIGMENGLIKVSWMSGTDSKVVPEDIFEIEYIYCGGDDLGSVEPRTFVEKLFFDFLEVLAFYRMIFLWSIKHLIPFRLQSNGEENEGQCQRISCCYSSSKGFEITEDKSDHYFVAAEKQSTVGRKWLKKVQEDWRLLQKDLPDGIFARVYEDRMDLLRAMIVGPYGTPYQDGLFFFDFHLPPEYPDVPPVVHYHSGGWKINPNLNEDGKICLSLLNTWHGKGNEVWDSSSSSILQVLVSIQGLVLNSKPYFNEAGYDNLIGSMEGENDSISYNENAYLLNCKSMMHFMRHPLKGFEELMREHFISRAYYILKACDAYMKGYQIGCLTKDASPSKYSKMNANSLGLKQTLATKIIPKLFFALDEVGADCHEFMYLLQT